jgi:hypothetical protein
MSRARSIDYYYKQTLECRVLHLLSQRKTKKKKKGFETKIRRRERAALQDTLRFAKEMVRLWRRTNGLPKANCVLKPSELLNKTMWQIALLIQERCGTKRK